MTVGSTEMNALLGVVVPILVAFITNTQTSSKVKGLLALGLSVAVGAVTAYFSGNLGVVLDNPAEFAKSIMQNAAVVAVAAQTAFTMFIKPTGLAELIQAKLGYKDNFDLDESSEVFEVDEAEDLPVELVNGEPIEEGDANG